MTTSVLPRVREESMSSRVDAWTSAAVLLVPFATVTGVAAASGGFNATSFGWTALAFAWLVILVVTLAAPAWGAFDVAWLTAAAGICVYTFASTLWSGSASVAIENGQRTLEYLAGIAAALLIVRRGRVSLWLGGLSLGAAAICVYSLATRLFPDRFGAFNADAGYRLFVPIGYWNALGIFASMALLIGLGVATVGAGPRAPDLSRRCARPAQRDAVLHLQPRRTRRAGGRPPRGVRAEPATPSPARRCRSARSGSGRWRADRLSGTALTHQATALGAAAHAGHRLALELALLAAGQAALAAVYVVWLSRIKVGRTARGAAGAAAVAVMVSCADRRVRCLRIASDARASRL